MLVVRLALADKDARALEWPLAALAQEAVRMPLVAERVDDLVREDGIFTSSAAGLVKADMATFAIRVTLVHHKCLAPMLHPPIVIDDEVRIRIGAGHAARRARIQERVSAISTEEVHLVVVPHSFRRLLLVRAALRIADKVGIVDGDIALIDDGGAAVEAPGREELVVVEMAVWFAVVLEEGDVLE